MTSPSINEEDAKNKMCPAIMSGGPREDMAQTCWGSACMTWRWSDQRFDTREEAMQPDAKTGYCGLAGRPS